MAGIYKIGSKLGYDIANGLQIGESITVKDGSVWTKDADGKIKVQHGGNTYTGEITYQPEVIQSGTGNNKNAEVTAPVYQSNYAKELQDTIKQMQNASWEGWNKAEDPAYQALRKEYLREADRTMADTLAQYSQNTGGIAGSQAITAASQAADYQKAKLADAIPTLHDNAYSRYLSELQQKQNAASLMLNAESQDQSLYFQNLSYAMNKWAQMGYADADVAAILGVPEGTPTSDQSYTDWAKSMDEKSTTAGGPGTEPDEEPDEEPDTEEILRQQKINNLSERVKMLMERGKSADQIFTDLFNAGYDLKFMDDVFKIVGL